MMKSGNLFKESTFHRNKFSSSYSGYLADDDATAGKQINLVRNNQLFLGGQLEVDNATWNYVKKGTLGSCWLLMSPRVWICEIMWFPRTRTLIRTMLGSSTSGSGSMGGGGLVHSSHGEEVPSHVYKE